MKKNVGEDSKENDMNVNVTPDCNDVDQENSNNVIRKKSYANKLSSGVNDKDNELFLIPTSMKENGEKVVVFDEEIIKEESEKWKFTGISALASRLGRLIKMDQITVDMCKTEEENHNDKDPFIDKRLIADEFIKKKLQPTCEETKNWSYDMINYFKNKWEAMERKDVEMGVVKEFRRMVVHSFQMDLRITAWNIKRMCKELKQKEACEYVFGRWIWMSNVVHSPTCCRIVVGWNADKTDVMMVQNCKELWNVLNVHKSIVNNKAWVIMGDFNVTLKPTEHSNGSSSMTIDMNEFYDVVNKIEKLDRIMINDSFIQQFDKANGVFLRYLVSDHNPNIMSILKGIPKKSFRFSNYVADKEEFLDIVKEGWRHEMKGCHMYKVVQRLKLLKKPLNNLNWQNGNLFYRTKILKEKLIEAQEKVDFDPFNLAKNQAVVNWLNDYTKAAEEIESICCEDGSRVEGELVNDQFVKHFHNFLGTTFPVSPLNSMCDIVKFKLSEAESLDMIIEIDDEEIKEALFDTDSSKAAGLMVLLLVSSKRNGELWDFLKEVMLMVGFHETMVNWIMTCITSAYFSICVNGEVSGFFKGGRCLRQGDPISPYLFTLVMEAFNIIMIKKHDLMILCNGDIESLKVVKKSLDDFSGVSSLFSNLSKSTIFFGSISESLKEEMLQILPFKCDKLPMKYLGVPLLAKRLGVKDCQSLIDSFLWNPGGFARGKTKVAWKYMCRPKDQGVKLKGKSIWEADIESNDSHGWKELMRIRAKIKPYVRFRFGDGKSISVWHDKWCDQGLLDKIINNKDIYHVRMSNETCLADAIEDGRWKWVDE
nr:hypothetical protein [Tanacetum cinerariifolium]